MGSLLTCTSTNRPSAIKGDVYFEVDTQRLVVYNGNYWLNYSPSGSGAIVDTINAAKPLQIKYVATLDEMLTEEASPGDMFLVDRQHAKARIIFEPERILNSDNNFTSANASKIYFRTSNTLQTNNYRFFEFRTDSSRQIYHQYTRFRVYDEDKFNIRGITDPDWQGMYYFRDLINQEDNGLHSSTQKFSQLSTGEKYEIINPELTDYTKIGAATNTAEERFIYNGEPIENIDEITDERINLVNTSLHGLFEFEISGEFNNVLTIIDSSEFWRSRPTITWGSGFTNTVHFPSDEDFSTPPNITIEQFSAKKDYQLIFFVGLNQYISLLNPNNN